MLKVFSILNGRRSPFDSAKDGEGSRIERQRRFSTCIQYIFVGSTVMSHPASAKEYSQRCKK